MEGLGRQAVPEIGYLGRRVLLVFWDGEDSDLTPTHAVSVGGSSIDPPVLRLTAPIAGNGVRGLLAFGLPEDARADAALEIRGRDNALLLSASLPDLGDRHGFDGMVEPERLLAEMADIGRVRLIRFLLHNCRISFGLNDDDIYIAAMRSLIEALSTRPGTLEAHAWLDATTFLASGSIPPDALGASPLAVTVGENSIIEALLAPALAPGAEEDNEALFLALGGEALGANARVVVFGMDGAAVRRLEPGAQPRGTIVEWAMRAGNAGSALWTYAVDALGRIGQSCPTARAAASEILALERRPDLGLEAVSAVSAGTAMVLCGTLDDPDGLIDAVLVDAGSWQAEIEPGRIVGFARSSEPRGFVALAEAARPAPEFGLARLTIRLGSGTRVDAGRVPIEGRRPQAAKAILAAVPPRAVTGVMISAILGPALDRLTDPQADATGPDPVTRTDPGQVVAFGDPIERPRASLIVAVSRNRELSAARLAALGVWLAGQRVEVIFTLAEDSRRAETEAVLARARRRFGLAMRLVVAPEGTIGADIRNEAVRIAAGERIIFLGPSSMPADDAAIEHLISGYRSSAGGAVIGAVIGGVILNADGSVHSAGFDAPAPVEASTEARSLPPASGAFDGARPVFACGSDFLAVDRAVFEAAGGFADRYFRPHWRDAEFCVRAREAGALVVVEPAAAALRCDPDAAAGEGEANALADRLDSWRFARNRGDDMTRWSRAQAAHGDPGTRSVSAGKEPEDADDASGDVSGIGKSRSRWAA